MFKVSVLIALLGLFSAAIQSVLGLIMKLMGAKYTIMIGLVFEIMQLMWFGFGSETWYIYNIFLNSMFYIYNINMYLYFIGLCGQPVFWLLFQV